MRGLAESGSLPPTPGHSFGEHTSQERTNSGSDRPHSTDDAEELATLAHAEHITDADVDEDDQATTTDTLDDSSRDEHANADTDARQQTSDEEYAVGHEDGWLATPDVTEFAPTRHRASTCDEVC